MVELNKHTIIPVKSDDVLNQEKITAEIVGSENAGEVEILQTDLNAIKEIYHLDRAKLEASIKERFNEIAVLTKLLREQGDELVKLRGVIDEQQAKAVAEREHLIADMEQQTSLVGKLQQETLKLKSDAEKIKTEKLAEVENLRKELLKVYEKNISDRETHELAIKKINNQIISLKKQLQIYKEQTFNVQTVLVKELGNAINILLEIGSWPFLTANSRLKHKIKLLKRSGLFDPVWYLKKYIDVAKAGVDPVLHYIRLGIKEGRLPNSKMDDILSKDEQAELTRDD